MAPLTYFRNRKIAIGVHPENIRVKNLGNVILRIINMQDATDAAFCNCSIIDTNYPDSSEESIAIFLWAQHVFHGYIGWEGAIELGGDQDLLCTFQDSYAVAPTAGDILYLTIGFEMLRKPRT